MSKETSSTAWTRATSRENSPPRIGKYFFKFLTRNSASAISMLLHGEECGAGWFRATRTPGRGDGQYLWVLVRSNFEPAVGESPSSFFNNASLVVMARFSSGSYSSGRPSQCQARLRV